MWTAFVNETTEDEEVLVPAHSNSCLVALRCRAGSVFKGGGLTPWA